MPQFDSSHAVVARGLTKIYGKTRAVDDLSFDVPFGSVTGFLGPNGAGKTTTVRMILGLVRPDEGIVTVLGKPYQEHSRPSGLVGALLDGSGGHPWRRGRDHLRILAALAGLPRGRVDEVLDLVDLGEHATSRVSTFSLGMRQRLGIAAALLGDPQLLILDEPANGLDPAGIRWLRGFLRSFADDGKAVFVSSHVLTEVTHVADRVLIITRGALVAESNLDQLTGQAHAAVRVRTSEAERLHALLHRDGIEVEGLEGGQLRVIGTTTADVRRLAARHGIPVLESSTESSSLEEVFLELTGGIAGELTSGIAGELTDGIPVGLTDRKEEAGPPIQRAKSGARAPRRTSLSQLAAAEVLRMRTTPLIWILVAGALALVGVSIASGIAAAASANVPLAGVEGQHLVFASAQAGWIFTLALGISSMAGEYRHRTASATFLAEPRRWRVFAAKVTAHWLVGLLFGLLCGAATLAITRVWARVSGVGLPLTAEVWRVLGGGIVTIVLYALLGVGVGALLRSQVAALAAVLGWSLIVEPLLGRLWPGIGKYFPNGAASALTAAPGPDLLTTGTGTLLFAGYVTVFLLLGLQSVRRRDVTT